jgi:hypothetical protein
MLDGGISARAPARSKESAPGSLSALRAWNQSEKSINEHQSSKSNFHQLLYVSIATALSLHHLAITPSSTT